jgi:spore coat polysaccharide biosynthesis predicted glycosyltransferase SpsG
MGGTDPLDSSLAVARSLVAHVPDAAITVIVPERLVNEVERIVGSASNARVVAPTNQLPALLAQSDVAVSAAGTSAWDLCTIGIPSVLVAVVENQRASLGSALGRGVALGVDAIDDAMKLDIVGELVSSLQDSTLADRLTSNCDELFDGLGPSRIVQAMKDTASSK